MINYGTQRVKCVYGIPVPQEAVAEKTSLSDT